MVFKPVKPEDASTVILVRDDGGGIEVYVTRRQDHLLFLGGYHVFPGGKVDEDDRSAKTIELCRGRTPEQACTHIEGVDEPDRAVGFMVAGIRELFEEAGVLLAEREDGSDLRQSGPGQAERLAGHRKKLQQDKIGFQQIMEKERLRCPLDRLLWFAHWITPATSPRRFNTFFFAAKKPEGQETQAFEDEIAEAFWVRPEKALENWRKGQWKMIPPTISSLDTLAGYKSWDDIKNDLVKPHEEHRRVVVKDF
jgi:8-oxo-dGTP pyrophosphatase MutT (NUDIX family)